MVVNLVKPLNKQRIKKVRSVTFFIVWRMFYIYIAPAPAPRHYQVLSACTLPPLNKNAGETPILLTSLARQIYRTAN